MNKTYDLLANSFNELIHDNKGNDGKNRTANTVNSSVYAMQILQHEMAGEGNKSGLTTEEDILNTINELRSND